MEWITNYFYDAIAINDYLWFIEDDMNALFKMNMKTLKMEYVLSFTDEAAVSRLYKFIGKTGNKLVCCPKNAKMIMIYDVDSGERKTIGVDFDRYKSNGAGMYAGGVLGNKVYIPRQGYSEIYQLDFQSGELSNLNIVNEKTELGMNDYFWHGRIRRYGSDTEMLLYSIKHNAFYRYNVLTCEAQKIICIEGNRGLIDFVTDGSCIWGLFGDGTIYKWDGFQVIDKYQYNATKADSIELLQYKKTIYIMDILAGKIILSLKSDADEGEDISGQIPNNSTELFNYCFNEDDYFWMQWKDGFFYYYDGMNEVSGIFESDLEMIPAAALLPKEKCMERENFSLQKMLRMLKYQSDEFRSTSVGQAGVRIYNAIVTD